MWQQPLQQPLQLNSNVASNLSGQHRSLNNGLLLDSNTSATGYECTSRAYRGDDISRNAIEFDHRADTYLD
jgi:hypothetical protein